jgi:hypothetical protein
MAKTRNQSSILNGGQSIEFTDPSITGLNIKAVSDDQNAPLLELERTIGLTEFKFEPVEIIDFSMDFYVETTGDDTTGNGSEDKPWATPHRAMEWLDKRSIVGESTVVTINIGSGDYTFDKPIFSRHPHGEKIHFIGAAPSGTIPRGFDRGIWYNNPGGAGSASTGVKRTNPEIESATTANPFSNTAGTMSSESAIDDFNAQKDVDKIANGNLIRAAFSTVFEFNGDGTYGISGFIGSQGDIGFIDNIAIIGDGNPGGIVVRGLGEFNEEDSPNANGVVVEMHSKITLGANIAIHNFGYNGIYAINGEIACQRNPRNPERFLDNLNTGISITNCKYGAQANHGGSIFIPSATIQGCELYALYSRASSSLACPDSDVSGNHLGLICTGASSAYTGENSYFTGNYIGIYILSNGHLYGNNLFANGNLDDGIHVNRNGELSTNSIQANGNGEDGIRVENNSLLYQSYYPSENVPTPQVNGNGHCGIRCYWNSFVSIRFVHIWENNNPGIFISYGASVDCNSPTEDIDDGYIQTEIWDNGKNPVDDLFYYSPQVVVGAEHCILEARGVKIYQPSNKTGEEYCILLSSQANCRLENTEFVGTTAGRVAVYAYYKAYLFSYNAIGLTSSRCSPTPGSSGGNYDSMIVLL